MSKTFRQYDSRWGKKGYPSGSGCTMSGSGCGPTACADIVVNNPKYKSKTPNDTRKFMCDHGYAIAGQGTAWNGIDACMKHYGFNVKRFDSMDAFFKEMSKENRWAIILFRGGSRGGVKWTSSGHFVCASAYKVKNGKHYLYTRDPGLRNNDGWHCYEDHMKGLIVKLWVFSLPSSSSPATTKKTKKKYTGVFPKLPSRGYFKKGDKGAQVGYLQKFLNWAVGTKLSEKLKVDKDLGSKTVSAVKTFEGVYGLTKDGEFGKKCLKKAKSIKK